MANIDSINVENEKILINLKLTKEEYELLKQSTRKLLLLPTESNILNDPLTTGKLGNSNRIMLPNKILRRHNVTKLLKRVPAKIFDINDEKFLLIKLQESTFGKPIFGEKE